MADDFVDHRKGVFSAPVKRLYGLQGQSGNGGKARNICPYRELNLCNPAHNQVISLMGLVYCWFYMGVKFGLLFEGENIMKNV